LLKIVFKDLILRALLVVAASDYRIVKTEDAY